MDEYSDNEYVLVMEDCSACKSEQEVGKLSVISRAETEELAVQRQGQEKTPGKGKNESQAKGNKEKPEAKLKGVEPKKAKEAEFMTFHERDGVLGNFVNNFLAQFKQPKHIGLYKVLASNIEEGVNNLRTLLSERDKPENKAQLDELRVDLSGQRQENKTAIDPTKVKWEQLEVLGLTKEQLEKAGELEKLLSYQKTNLLPVCIPAGDTLINTEVRLVLRTDSEGQFYFSVHALRKEPQLDYPFMGYQFTEEDKAQLLHSGNLGKIVELTPRVGEPFKAFISIDPQTNEVLAFRADKLSLSPEIKGVQLSEEQHQQLLEGKAVKVEGMTSKSGKTFDATLQVNAEKRGIEFIFDTSKNFRERQQAEHNHEGRQGIPHKLCGLELSEKQQHALQSGATLYLKNMIDKEGQPFNAYVKMNKEQNRPRFYKWHPDKKQTTGKEKVVAVAEEHKTQVAVNNEGKTNEATKHVKEPLKSKQTQPTEKQAETTKQKKGRKL